MDVFKITLAKGATLTIDMDYTTGGFDPGVESTRDGLNFLTIFDDGLIHAGAGGSVSQLDSFGTFTAWDGGTYYIVRRRKFSPTSPWARAMSCMSRSKATTDTAGSGAGNDTSMAAVATIISTAAPVATR